MQRKGARVTEGGVDSRSKVSKQQPTGKSRLANSVWHASTHTNSHVPPAAWVLPREREGLQHGPKGIKYLLSGLFLWEKSCQPLLLDGREGPLFEDNI